MTINILLLAVIGLALAMFHLSSVIIPLFVILALSFLAIKLFWRTMQVFSSSAQASRTAVPVHSN